MEAGVLVSLGALVLASPVLPVSEGQSSALYDAVACTALVLGWVALWRHRPVRMRSWVLLLGGFSAWAAGDLVWSLEQDVLHLTGYPNPSDALYLGGYALLAAGALSLARSRVRQRDLTALLDACILAAGITVPAAVFIIVPAAAESSLSLAGKLTASAYPVGDLILMAMLTRLLATPGGRSWSFAAVAASLLIALAADAWWNVAAVAGSDAQSPWADEAWLGSYVLMAAAVTHRSMHGLVERPPDSLQLPTKRRLTLLAVGSVLPAVTLFAAGLMGRDIPWLTVSVGGVIMSALVLTRMAGLLDRVREQAVQLAAMARRDELTGAPNRRSWNYELSRACAAAQETGRPLCVAILDLDLFKRYNDSFGHLEGDRLLREAVAVWTDALPEGGRLARYGGEEFAVLLPDIGLSDAAACIQALADVTPSGQTFSAGVALWTPGTDPASVVSAADVALYAAKSGGRNRIETVAGESRLELPAVLQDFTIALQPIVDATTGRVLAHEALSRFSHARDVAGVYAQAHREGHGDLLEATAIRRAIEVPGRPEGTELFVNVSAAALASERFWQLLPDDLSGLVVELLESRDSLDWESLRARMDQLLQRNARLAVDDLGAGSGDLARFLVIRPHVVKIDRALVDGCAHDGTRERLLEVVVDLAHASGSVVCAEGVEQQADLETLRALGVDLIQGYLIGRPSAAWTTSALLPV